MNFEQWWTLEMGSTMKGSKYLARKAWNAASEEYRGTLQRARGLICRHHDASIVQTPGCYCPVCHHQDGTEPVMDEIAKMITATGKP